MTLSVNSLAERAVRRPMAEQVRKRLEADINIIFSRVLNRSDWVREFMLGSNVASDLLMLFSPLSAQSSFILDTEEHQEGRLTGNIRLRYLVVPSFSTPDGLSGGAVVTSYARRNHPLHRPNVMATTRIGRFIRDNNTGEWLIITRNESDNVTRVQWLHSSKATTRERICMTCNTSLFNKGMFVESILFECHDEEWRPCPHCHAPPESNCKCSASHSALVVPKHPLDLHAVAAAALGEPKSEWFGRVQVSVLSNLSRDLRGDVDACMQLRTSFEASQDAQLAQQMQNLALAERAKGVIPRNVVPPKLLTDGVSTQQELGSPQNVFGEVIEHTTAHAPNQHLSTSTVTQSSAPPLQDMLSHKSFPEAVNTEMLDIESKSYAHDDEEHASGIVLNAIAASSSENATQPSAPSPGLFDPMALLLPKHVQSNGVDHMANTSLEHPSTSTPAAPRAENGIVGAHKYAQSQSIPNGNHPVLDGMEHAPFPPSFSALQRSGNSTSSSSGSSQEAGGTRTNQNAAKSFDSFMSHFVAPHPGTASHGAEVSGLESVDVVHHEGWLNPAALVTNKAPKTSSAIRKRRSMSNGNRATQTRTQVVAPGNAAPVMHLYVRPGVPENGVPNGVANGNGRAHPPVQPTVVQKSSPAVTPVTVIMKNPPVETIRPMSAPAFPTGNGSLQHRPPVAVVPVPNSSENFVSTEIGEDASSPANLVRLEPRPPGMAAHADGHWMWQMGHRGAFGMAAIAAARERERRAEERRRKNREAAARSNARAKERIMAIKGELEKNRERIADLSKRRTELQSLNSSLKLQLSQHVETT